MEADQMVRVVSDQRGGTRTAPVHGKLVNTASYRVRYLVTTPNRFWDMV